MSRDFFQQLSDALVGFLQPNYRQFVSRTSGRNIKVWWGDEPREHYEVQFMRGGLEIGFHTEHPSADRNDQVLARLTAAERRWRRALGPDPEAGTFLGMRSSPWRRVSEVWMGPEILHPEAAIEAADRLCDYVHALEPIRAGAARRVRTRGA